MPNDGPKTMAQLIAELARTHASGEKPAGSPCRNAPASEPQPQAAPADGPPPPPSPAGDRLERALDTSPVCVTLADRDGRVIYANRRARELLGLHESSSQPPTYNDPAWKISAIDGGPFPDEELPFQLVRRTGQPVEDVRHAVETPDGRRVALSINAAPLWDATGEFDGMAASLEDITERLAVEVALRDDEARLSSIFRAAPVGIGMVVDRVFREVNDRFLEMLGYEREELVGHSARVIYPSREEFERVGREKYRQIRQSGTGSVETRMLRKDGRVIDVLLSSSPLNPNDLSRGVSFTAMDMTERNRAEEALRESEERFSRMLGVVPDMISIHDAEMNILYSNWQGFAAVPAEKRVLGAKCYETYRGYDSICPDCRAKQVLETGEPFQEEVQLPDGRWVDLRVIPLPTEDGSVKTFMEWVRDVTDRKRVEQALLASEREKDLILNSAGEMIAYYDTDLRVIWANRAAAESVGSTSEQLVGQCCHDVWHQRETPCTDCPVLGARDAKLPQQGEVQSPDGRYWFLRGYPVLNDNGEVIALVEFGRDITEQKHGERERERLEDQLRQAQKMEAVGQLAGGVAHDFNNLWQAISGYADLALTELPNGDEAISCHLQEVKKAADRAAAVTRQLLTFSRRETLQPRNISLNEVIGDLSKMLHRVLGEHVQLRLSTRDGLRPVYADPGQMHQVIINLCVNARDAMPAGGTLRLETRNVELTEEDCRDRPKARPGPHVLLTVADSGVGIPEGIRQRVFEPFFTTKEVGQGTGLGLATVYAIVKRHDGFIELDSTPGEGTEFRIYLPAVEGAAVGPQAAARGEGNLRGDGLVILLAEDDESVRGLIERILRDMGYEVLSAADGEQAARIVEREGPRLNLAVLDVIMPHRGGKYVYDVLRRRELYIPVLFSSGYSRNALDDEGVPPDAELIQKPYAPDDLLRRVRSLLAGA